MVVHKTDGGVVAISALGSRVVVSSWDGEKPRDSYRLTIAGAESMVEELGEAINVARENMRKRQKPKRKGPEIVQQPLPDHTILVTSGRGTDYVAKPVADHLRLIPVNPDAPPPTEDNG